MPKPYAGYDPSLPKSIIKISYPSGEEITIDDLVKKPASSPKENTIESVLNQLSRKDFEKTKTEFIKVAKLETDSPKIAASILDQALTDPNFVDLYVALAKTLDNKNVTSALLNSCQDEFQKESPASKFFKNESDNNADGMWEEEEQFRKRRTNNLLLLGELFKSGLLNKKATQSIINELLEKCSSQEDYPVQEYCTFLNAVGPHLSSDQEYIVSVMSRTDALAQSLQGLLQEDLKDLLNLYNNGWQVRYN
ncbi:translation initiation factor isoform 4G [Acrasis kona]|uniref:Translation initiation factor isoform 4G n=1 Tax=Acrasis kona TaxID=1008807 RepID=A0AAW2Z0B0_9EUKA